MKTGEEARKWMARCLELAQQAREQGEAAVGAVVIRDGQIVAEAMEQDKSTHDPTAHAELLAIRAACQRLETLDLSDCILVTNVEPCWMCSFVIREARIGKVVIGRAVEGIGGATSAYPILTTDTVPEWSGLPEITWLKE